MTSSSLPETAIEVLTDAQRIELLRGLVAIPSTSRNEADAVAYLCRWMTELGFDAGPTRPAARSAGSERASARSCCSATSTPCRAKSRSGSRMACCTAAARSMPRGRWRPSSAAAAEAAERANATITVVGAVGEESIGSPGATAVANWPAPDFCIIGEPSGWDAVCLGYRGTISITYRLRQACRHTAGPGETVGGAGGRILERAAGRGRRRNEGVTERLHLHRRDAARDGHRAAMVSRTRPGCRSASALPPAVDVDGAADSDRSSWPARPS